MTDKEYGGHLRREPTDRAGGRELAIRTARTRSRRFRHHEMMTEDDPRLDGRLCLLRTSPGRAIALAESLRSVGVDAWTPVEVRRVRRPRSNRTKLRHLAILPGFVFASARKVVTLRIAARAEWSVHPAFSLFEDAEGVWLTTEEEIAGLRRMETESFTAEERAKHRDWLAEQRKRKHEPMKVGAKVRPAEGCFTGLTGDVLSSNERRTSVAFGGNGMRVTFETFQIAGDRVGEGKS